MLRFYRGAGTLYLRFCFGGIPFLMSSRQEFIEFILDHYENPRNRGALEPADVVMKGGNPACGDVVTVYLRIDPLTQVIERITFTGEGCTISQAAASLTTTKIRGRTVDGARVLRAVDILSEMGDGVMGARRRCATLALHTLRAALTCYLKQDQSPSDEEAGLRFEEQGSSRRIEQEDD
ncbi:MAG: iron-sulfur cluster assembly scaffold protein [Chloroflexota bacterium]|nr:iron-sulfur cluster assembly scaffold protein [Chloroflexota bacterium]